MMNALEWVSSSLLFLTFRFLSSKKRKRENVSYSHSVFFVIFAYYRAGNSELNYTDKERIHLIWGRRKNLNRITLKQYKKTNEIILTRINLSKSYFNDYHGLFIWLTMLIILFLPLDILSKYVNHTKRLSFEFLLLDASFSLFFSMCYLRRNR